MAFTELFNLRAIVFLELSTTLKLLLPDLIRVNQEEQLVIEQFSGENLTKSELFDVLKTLSQDTGEHIHAYVGFFVERDDLKSLYFEEKKWLLNRVNLIVKC